MSYAARRSLVRTSRGLGTIAVLEAAKGALVLLAAVGLREQTAAVQQKEEVHAYGSVYAPIRDALPVPRQIAAQSALSL